MKSRLLPPHLAVQKQLREEFQIEASTRLVYGQQSIISVKTDFAVPDSLAREVQVALPWLVRFEKL